ncbi:50S ribosomal protein L5 [Candidatus Woesearchaeota archaeon]|nr:50S ribosomal protein L5 [Candidatus Woesearchaeota archaeon]
MDNKMRQIKIEKITLNIGAGKDQTRLEKGVKLIKHITNVDPVKTITKKRIPSWGVRPGLPIGCKLTIRDTSNIELIKRFLKAKANKLVPSNFDENGSIAFGIHEYIDIPQVGYNPDVGLMGLQVCITLEKAGFRIKRRKYRARKIPAKQRITKEAAIKYMQETFGITVEE